MSNTNKDLAILPNTFGYRILEVMPGFLTWTSIIGAFVLAIFKPIILANLIIIYDVYWLLRSLRFAALSAYVFKKVRTYPSINWQQKLKQPKSHTWARGIDEKEIYQAIILVHYKESYELLKNSIASYARSKYNNKKQLILVLASEERAGKEAIKTYLQLKKEFGSKFYKFFQTIHPSGLPGEIKGKSSNATWAGRFLKTFFDEQNIPYQNVILHNFDADTRVHPSYFAHIAYRFLNTPITEHISYQPIHIYSNNIWDTPAIIRLVATSSTTIFMHNALRPHRLKNFSSRSDCFQTLVDIDFWAPDIIPEDSRQYWDSFFRYRGNIKIEPIFVPLRLDAVLAENYLKTIKNQYQQLRRWAWGVSDFPYVVSRALADRTISWSKKTTEIFFLLESHYSWANSTIIITILAWLPFIFHRSFNATILGYQLPIVAGQILTLAVVGIFVTTWISLFLYQPRPKHQPRYAGLKFIWQWLFVPIASVLFSSAAAIDAQTRLMLGKRLEYQVAEKVIKRHSR